MLFVLQSKFIMTAANKLIPIISAPDGSLLTNEDIREVQNPANRVFACRGERDKGMIELVRFGAVSQTVGANERNFRRIIGGGDVQMDAILLTTELNKTFAKMLRNIGLEQEVPVMLPSRWLTI